MPAYSFVCQTCHKATRAILSVEDAKRPRKCDCGGSLKRVPRPPSTQIVETLDNGLMPRKLERLADAETIFNERAHGKKGVI